ncbi:MAG: putative peptidoglycan lipid II flippase [Thalassolituus oleivorans]
MKKYTHLALVVINLALGLGVQLWIIRLLGFGESTDVYVSAQVIYLILLGVLTSALHGAWFPKIVKNYKDVSHSLVQGVSVSIVFMMVLIGFGEDFVGYIFTGFSTLLLDELIGLIIIFSIALCFQSINVSLLMMLRANEKYIEIEKILFFTFPIYMVSILVLTKLYGASGAAFSLLIKNMAQIYISKFYLSLPRINLYSSLSSTDGWRRMRPVIVGGVFYKSSPLVDRYWLSQSVSGSLTIVNLANTIITSLMAIVEKVYINPIVTNLNKIDSNMVRKNYYRALFQYFLLSLLLIAFIFMIHPVFMWFFSLVLGISSKTSHDLWLYLLMYIGVFVGGGGGVISICVMNRFDDTKTSSILGSVMLPIGIIIKSFGYYYYSIPGLVVGTSVYYLINLIILVYFVERRVNESLS